MSPISPLYSVLVSMPTTIRLSGRSWNIEAGHFLVSMTKRTPGLARQTGYSTGMVIATSPSADRRMTSTLLGASSLFAIEHGVGFGIVIHLHLPIDLHELAASSDVLKQLVNSRSQVLALLHQHI